MIEITAEMAASILKAGRERAVKPREAQTLYERDIQTLLTIPAKKLAQVVGVPFQEKELGTSLRNLAKAMGGTENELVLSMPAERDVPCDFELDVKSLKNIVEGRSKPGTTTAGSAVDRLAQSRGKVQGVRR